MSSRSASSISTPSRNVNKLMNTVGIVNQTNGHELYHNEKMHALQTTITKLEARLREADRLNKDNHRVELIKSLRMQLREALTTNETLMTICGNHGIERHHIEPQLDAARARVKLVGIKKISEMRQEIDLLRLQLKREQSKKSPSKHVVEHIMHVEEEKTDEKQVQTSLINESLHAECDALKHRLSVTLDTLQALEERFQILSTAHSQLKMTASMQNQTSHELPHNVMADVFIDQDEIGRIEQHWSNEVKRIKLREARLLAHQQDLQIELDRANADQKKLIARCDELEEQVAEQTRMLDELQNLFDDTKCKLKRFQKHHANDFENSTLVAENFELKERVRELEKQAINGKTSRSTKSITSCQNCSSNLERITDLRAELRVARMINDSIKDVNNDNDETREFEIESMIELSESYEKQIANLNDTITKLRAQQKRTSSTSHHDRQSSSEEWTSSDSEQMSLHDLEEELNEL